MLAMQLTQCYICRALQQSCRMRPSAMFSTATWAAAELTPTRSGTGTLDITVRPHAPGQVFTVGRSHCMEGAAYGQMCTAGRHGDNEEVGLMTHLVLYCMLANSSLAWVAFAGVD